MKKSIIFMIAFCLFAFTAGAQEEEVGKKIKDYHLSFTLGPRVGVGVSTMSESEGLKVYDKSGLSFDGGIAGNLRFGNKENKCQGLFGIGFELNYKYYSMKTLGEGNDDIKLNYFEVPVLAQVYPFFKGNKNLRNIYIEAGATISGSLSSKPDYITQGITTYKTGDLKGYDVKPTIGIGYRFSPAFANKGFYVSARYSFGVSKLADNFPGKVSSGEITFGYLFQIAPKTKVLKSNDM